jgi:hypothetical protein
MDAIYFKRGVDKHGWIQTMSNVTENAEVITINTTYNKGKGCGCS